MTDTTAILARLRAATGPSYELDLLIREWKLRPAIGDLSWPAFSASAGPPKPYSASIDAALSLVPEGHELQCGMSSRGAWAQARPDDGGDFTYRDPTHTAPTLPLAVLLAAITAREARDE